MTDIITLTCPSCGGKLQITSEIELFACSYCGNEHVVRRSGGIVSLAPVVESLGKVQTGVDKTASELAIRRLREDLGGLKSKLEGIKIHQERKVIFGLILAFLGCVLFVGLLVLKSLFSYPAIFLSLFLAIISGKYAVDGLKKSDEELELESVIKEKQSQLNQHEGIVGR